MLQEASRKLSTAKDCLRWLQRAVVAVALGFAVVQGIGIASAETYAAFVARMNASPPAGAVFREDLEETLRRAANAYRKSKGAKPLQQAEAALVDAARAHAADMLQGEFVGHTSTSGAGFESRMRALNPGVMMLPRMAENAARERSAGAPDAAKAGKLFQQWVKSSAHAKTLRSRDYVAVATGVVESEGKLYAVQIFVGPELKTNMFGAKPAGADAGNATLY